MSMSCRLQLVGGMVQGSEVVMHVCFVCVCKI